MGGPLGDDETRVSPTTSLLDPTAISGDEWKPSDHGYQVIRYVRAPATGGPHTLKFKCPSGWGGVDMPGQGAGSGEPGFVHTATLADNEPLGPLQICAIVKTGSTGGDWQVAP